MSVPQDSKAPLEDNLRNMILNNSENSPPGLQAAGQDASEYGAIGGNQSEALFPASKAAKKRPNQAQRRQMSSQMTIDIDPRSTMAPPMKHNGAQSGFHRGRDYDSHGGPPGQHPLGHRGGFHGHVGPHHRGHSHAPHHTLHHPPHHPLPPHQHHHRGHGPPPGGFSGQPQHQQHWRQHTPRGDLPTRGINVISSDTYAGRPSRNVHGSLYNPEGHRQYIVRPEELAAQSELLEQLCTDIIKAAEIEHSEIIEKENFRQHVEAICRTVVSDYESVDNSALDFQPESVQLKCFGSLSSGFATKASDMDVGLLSPNSKTPLDAPESPIPRLVEKALLDAGYGARLLTRTRVPIIKLCEKPTTRLHLDLLEERLMWEQGLLEDEPGAADEAIIQGDFTSTADAENPAVKVTDADTLTAETQVTVKSRKPAVETPQQILSSLRQASNQSLQAYHNQAKKVLRQLGGRDITHSNIGVFTDADYMLLDDVSAAFVEGLQDKVLRERVKLHTSFSCGKHVPNRRTLHGVCNMVEGENMVMLWENRVIFEGDPRTEKAYAKTIQWWPELHSTHAFGLDPLAFNREMFLSLERLRKIPSVQLMQLQQDQYESAAEYHQRAVKMMAQLNAAALAADSDPRAPPPAIKYYVAGIYDKEIRDEVEQFARTTNTTNIRAVARRHRSLHLAAEYARALEKGGLYHEDDTSTIEEYTCILRGDLTPALSDPHGYLLPIPNALTHVYETIMRLPNPAQSAPNQPKDRYHDKLEFPQSGVGVQCDINFSAHLALQNSLLLRCYAATDPRVRPMVLFVKHWAKARDINTPYRGTLSSYGYVMMVVHYLVNIVQPFVCPNLQILAPADPDLPPEELEGIATCRGRNVRFWRDEQEIQRLSREGVLTANKEPIGYLLRGFFEYYAQSNMMSTIQKRGFDWGRDIVSLRTPGGILSKQEKNWVQAKTTMQSHMGAPPTPVNLQPQMVARSPTDTITQSSAPRQAELPLSPDGVPKSDQSSKQPELKEVRHRFLFAIEDPFEHEHNVARTVTHNGIVAIRDEFRRAWRIIKSAGKTAVQEDLLENIKAHAVSLERKQFADLLAEIHGDMSKGEGYVL